MYAKARRVAGIAIGMVLIAPFISGVAQSQEPSTVAETVWPPADHQRVGDFPAFLGGSLNLSQVHETGVQPFDGYRIDPINATHAELRLVSPRGQTLQTFVLEHEPVGNDTSGLQFTPDDLDRPWVSVSRSGHSESIIGFRVVFPPGSVSVTPDKEGNPLIETAEAFSRGVGLSKTALPIKRIDWTITQRPSEDYRHFVTRSMNLLEIEGGCWVNNDTSCSGNVSTQMSCHCASVVGWVQPPAGQELTTLTDGEIRVGASSGRVEVFLSEEREVIAASFSPHLDPREENLLDPLEARERLVSFLENESGVEPLNETERNKNFSSRIHDDRRNNYKKVRLEFDMSRDRVEATGARYVWTVGFYKTFPDDPSRDRDGGGARVTMDAVTGEVLDAEYRWRPVTHGADIWDRIPGAGTAILPVLALAAIAWRRGRKQG